MGTTNTKLKAVGTNESYLDYLKRNISDLASMFKTIGTNMIVKPAAVVAGSLTSCSRPNCFYTHEDLIDGKWKGPADQTDPLHPKGNTLFLDSTARYYGPAESKQVLVSTAPRGSSTFVNIDFPDFYPYTTKDGQTITDSVYLLQHWLNKEEQEKLNEKYPEMQKHNYSRTMKLNDFYDIIGREHKQGGKINYLNIF